MKQHSLPSGWRWVTLQDVVAPTPNAIVDGPFGSSLKLSDYVPDGSPVLQGKNITGNHFQWFAMRFISEQKAHTLRRSYVRVGDILTVKIGSIGYSAIVDDLNGYSQAVIPANLAKITPNPETIDTRYLYRWLTSGAARDYLIGSASKTAQPALSLAKIKALPVPLPPIAEQKRIAAILDKADALRRKRREAIAKLDTLLKSVFLEMFGDLSINPRGWPLAELGSLVRRPVQNGAYFPQERYSSDLSNGVEMVHMSDAFYGIVDRGALRRVLASPEEISKYRVESSDLLIARRSLNYEGSAKPCLIPTAKEPLLFESSLIRVTPDPDKVTHQYLFHFFNDNRARQRYVLPRVTRSTISGINQDGLLKIRVPLPIIGLQEAFGENKKRIENVRSKLLMEEIEFSRLFESLQGTLFAGR